MLIKTSPRGKYDRISSSPPAGVLYDFDIDGDALKGEHKDKLDAIFVKYALARPAAQWTLHCEGTTSYTGASPKNVELSKRRADNVETYLRTKLPGKVLDVTTTGWGYRDAAATGEKFGQENERDRAVRVSLKERTPVIGTTTESFKIFSISEAAATLSWIDRRLFDLQFLPEVDTAPPASNLFASDIESRKRNCRFANSLEIQFNLANASIVSPPPFYTDNSGLYTRPSFLWTEPEPYPVVRAPNPGAEVKAPFRFRQIVGCRTVAPEKMAKAGTIILSAPSTILGGGSGIISAWPILSAQAETAASIARSLDLYAFPPIWTEIEIIVDKFGAASSHLRRHSFFPSVSFYKRIDEGSSVYAQESAYDGDRIAHDLWMAYGWGPLSTPPTRSPTPSRGNPWGIVRPTP